MFEQFNDKPSALSEEDKCIDGRTHCYVEQERNKYVQILTCKVCGHQSVGWFKQEIQKKNLY